MQAAQAEAQFAQARQDMILRVATAYFDDAAGRGQPWRRCRHKRNHCAATGTGEEEFRGGNGDHRRYARSAVRYDLATAREIAADSELEIKRRALEVIVGRDPGQLAMVREGRARQPAAGVEAVARGRRKDAISVQLQQLALEIADKGLAQPRRPLPTLDAVVTRSNAAQSALLPTSGGSAAGFRTTRQPLRCS